MVFGSVFVHNAKIPIYTKNAENFVFEPMAGTTEITTLSNSFEHMVVKIQKLMEQVRQEEITLRKTELKALQAQINPHSCIIHWMRLHGCVKTGK